MCHPVILLTKKDRLSATPCSHSPNIQLLSRTEEKTPIQKKLRVKTHNSLFSTAMMTLFRHFEVSAFCVWISLIWCRFYILEGTPFPLFFWPLNLPLGSSSFSITLHSHIWNRHWGLCPLEIHPAQMKLVLRDPKLVLKLASQKVFILELRGGFFAIHNFHKTL